MELKQFSYLVKKMLRRRLLNIRHVYGIHTLLFFVFGLSFVSERAFAENSYAFRAHAGASQFIQPLIGVSNSNTFLEFFGQNSGGAFESALSLRGSTEPGNQLSGNIHQLEFKFWEPFSIGRSEPLKMGRLNSLQIENRWNHKICVDPVTCFEGGPFGFHYNSNKNPERLGFRGSLILLNIPNFDPRPSLSANGLAESKNRWTVEPIQQVIFDDFSLPILNTQKFVGGYDFLWKPGFQGLYGFNLGKHKFDLGASFSVSKTPVISQSQNLSFGEIEGGVLGAVVQNQVSLSFPFEGLGIINYEFSTSNFFKFGVKGGASKRGNFKSGSAIGIATININPFTFILGSGFYKDRATYFISILDSELSFARWKISLNQQLISGDSFNFRGWVLEPKLSCIFSQEAEIYISALIIQSHLNIPVWGRVRGNDRVNLGAKYEF